MSVQELIDNLLKVKNKTLPAVICDPQCRTREIKSVVELKKMVAIDVPFAIPFKNSEQI